MRDLPRAQRLVTEGHAAIEDILPSSARYEAQAYIYTSKRGTGAVITACVMSTAPLT